MDDKNIVELFWRRDERAVAEAESAYGERLRRFSKGILKNSEDAEECVSDTLLKAWETIPPKKPDRLFAYLAKICRYISFGVLDKRNAQKRSAVLSELTAEAESCVPSSLEEKHFCGEEIGEALNSFLERLPKEQRIIFVRRYWFGSSVKEIAEMCGVSESKVKTSLHRTRKKLKQHLEKEGIYI